MFTAQYKHERTISMEYAPFLPNRVTLLAYSSDHLYNRKVTLLLAILWLLRAPFGLVPELHHLRMDFFAAALTSLLQAHQGRAVALL